MAIISILYNKSMCWLVILNHKYIMPVVISVSCSCSLLANGQSNCCFSFSINAHNVHGPYILLFSFNCGNRNLKIGLWLWAIEIRYLRSLPWADFYDVLRAAPFASRANKLRASPAMVFIEKKKEKKDYSCCRFRCTLDFCKKKKKEKNLEETFLAEVAVRL